MFYLSSKIVGTCVNCWHFVLQEDSLTRMRRAANGGYELQLIYC